MQLQLLNVEEFIIKNRLGEVTSSNIYSINKNNFDPKGLWSEEIFGNIGSDARKSKFGYIDLTCKIINPVMYDMVTGISSELRNILSENKRYEFKDDKLIEAEFGQTGIIYFVSIFDQLDFSKLCKPIKAEVAKFLMDNKKLILIDKQLILPAGIRDLSLTQTKGRQFSSEINELYGKMLLLVSQKNGQSEALVEMFTGYIQKTAIGIYKWIQSKIKGKQGLFQGSMLKKTIDFSARLVAISDPSIPLGTIGIPWHVVLTLYQPFFIHEVFNNQNIKEQIATFMNCDVSEINDHKLQDFNHKVNKYPDKVTGQFKNDIMDLIVKIAGDKDILCKRDPVVSRNSYYSGTIKVLPKGNAIIVSGLSVTSQGLDFDGDTLALFPLFTDEALLEAKKLNPAKTKSAWMDPVTSGHHYPLTLDTISTIYAATKE